MKLTKEEKQYIIKELLSALDSVKLNCNFKKKQLQKYTIDDFEDITIKELKLNQSIVKKLEEDTHGNS